MSRRATLPRSLDAAILVAVLGAAGRTVGGLLMAELGPY
jgi:hypothetical protein